MPTCWCARDHHGAVHFPDRGDAGRRLATELAPLAAEQPVVVALPRGGVPVGAEVARALGAPLQILAVRKLGAPGNPELGVGAIAEDGTAVLDERSARAVGMTDALLAETVERESAELRRRVAEFGADRPRVNIADRTVIVVDDGLATGLTNLAALRALRKQGAKRIIVAVPVGAKDSLQMLAHEADGVVCLITPRTLFGVGLWYEDFSPVSDEEVIALLDDASRSGRNAGTGGPSDAASAEA
jgi:putative phosphoribosyl transferase